MSTNTNTATLRTGWNLTLFSAVAAFLYKVFDWQVDVEDLLPYAPLIGVLGGVFYRLSRVVADKFPSVGFILFGTKKTPTDYTEPPAD